MTGKGISREKILNTAIEMVEELGFQNFSLRDLARKLHIQPPSIYNHFSGIEEINLELCIRVEEIMDMFLSKAIEKKKRDDAIRTLGNAHRQFAVEHPQLYRIILSLPHISDEKACEAAARTALPIYNILSEYQIPENDIIHLHRMFRSMMHGYISLTDCGYLSHRNISTEQSFDAMLDYFILLVNHLETEEISHAAN